MTYAVPGCALQYGVPCAWLLTASHYIQYGLCVYDCVVCRVSCVVCGVGCVVCVVFPVRGC